MGATQLPGTLIKDASIDIADLSATGTPSSSTFLRGDNTWAVPPGGMSGSGTAGTVPKFSAGTTLADSNITDSGGTVKIFPTDIGLLVSGKVAYLGDHSGLFNSTMVQVNDNTENITLEASEVYIGGNASPATMYVDKISSIVRLGDTLGNGNNTLLTINDTNNTATFTGTLNISSGQAYKINNTNMVQAVTANSSYWFGPSGNLTSAASSNLGVGSGVMTGGSVTGGFNVGVGNNALAAITSGSDNLAFGVYAMWKTTTGYYNCAFGSSALVENTEGFQNVGVGREALATNTKGNNNVAIGFQSLFTYNNSTATDAKNVAIGQAAGYDVTTGTFNTFIGGNTGRGITTGGKNTIIGAMVTGLSSSLANNVIIADGDGNIRLQFNNTGDGTIGGKLTVGKDLTLAAGTTAISPLRYTSGTNLTSAVAGATEYDGVQFYQTIDTTHGRAAVRMENYFHLTSTGSAITTINNFFGANSNIPLVANAYYEIEIFAFFLKTTAGTVTWSLTNSAAPTGQNIYYAMSPITGIVAPPGTATELNGQYYNDTTANRTFTTGSLSTGVNHFAYFKIFLRNGNGTSLQIRATSNTGSITPGINSWWKCTRRSPNNIGTFAA